MRKKREIQTDNAHCNVCETEFRQVPDFIFIFFNILYRYIQGIGKCQNRKVSESNF